MKSSQNFFPWGLVAAGLAGLILSMGTLVTPMASASSVDPLPATQPNGGMVYAVQAGDSLSAIARKNGVTIRELIAANPDMGTTSVLKVGQLIFVPPPAALLAANPPVTLSQLVTANNRFAFEFFHRASPKSDENAFFSPYSISTALAMTWAGARGNTAAQMATVLQYSAWSVNDVAAAFTGLQQSLALAQKQNGVELAIANSLWTEQSPEHPFLPEYLNLVQKNFGSMVMPMDFQNNAEAARLKINAWVEDKTNQKIKELLQKGPPPDVDTLTRIVLVNAIYFKGQWDEPFVARKTRTDAFHPASGSTKSVSLMHGTFSAGYANLTNASGSFQMLSLPYHGGGLSLVALLPATPTGLPGLEKSLTADQLATWVGKLSSQDVEIFLPKFKMEERYMLKDNLTALGMGQAFIEPRNDHDQAAADFSGMNGVQFLKIDKVIHQSFVEVDEQGTEAAAATAVIVAAPTGAMPGPRPPPPVFRADHPFLFLIRDNATGSILFLGRFANP